MAFCGICVKGSESNLVIGIPPLPETESSSRSAAQKPCSQSGDLCIGYYWYHRYNDIRLDKTFTPEFHSNINKNNNKNIDKTLKIMNNIFLYLLCNNNNNNDNYNNNNKTIFR